MKQHRENITCFHVTVHQVHSLSITFDKGAVRSAGRRVLQWSWDRYLRCMLACDSCISETYHAISEQHVAYLILSHWDTIRTDRMQSTMQRWGMCDCQGERCQGGTFSCLSQAQMLLQKTKGLFVKALSLNTFFYFMINSSVNCHLGVHNVLQILLQSKCLYLVGWKGKARCSWPEALVFVFESKAQLVRLKPTRVHQICDIVVVNKESTPLYTEWV